MSLYGMYVLVSAIHTLTLCMYMIVGTIRSVLISTYVCTCACINYVYLLHDEAIHQRREVCNIKSNAHFGV